MAKAVYPCTLCRRIEEKLKMTQKKFTPRDNDTTMANIVCGIVFCIFTFIYLYFYQADLLTMEQHILSNGITRYNRLIGAIILTILAFLLQYGYDAVTKRSIKQPALTYFPSALLLAILTDISPNVDQGYHLGKWTWLAPFMLLLYGGAIYLSFRNTGNTDTRNKKSIFRSIGENLVILFLFIIFVGTTANTNRIFHKRIKIENMIAKGNIDEAINEKSEIKDTDSTTTMLRAYALSLKGQLGEKLFEYPVCGKSDALLPNGTTTKCMIVNEAEIYRHVARILKQKFRPMHYLLWMQEHGYAKKPLKDYLLCAYLMDRNIDGFAKEIAKDKDIEHKKLAKHYKEALVLYNHIRSNPIVTYHNDVMEADYIDLQTLLRETQDYAKRKASIQNTYGNTYWYYYFYGNK